MARGPLTAADLAPYPRDGYVLARGLFDKGEVSRTAARRERGQGPRRPLVRPRRRRGRGRSALPLEPPRRRDLRHVRALPVGGGHLRAPPRGRGLPLPLEDDHEGGPRGRRVGLAPGLRLLVPERRPRPRPRERLHRGGPGHAGERLPAGAPGLAPVRARRPRADRRPGRGRSGAGGRDREAAAARARRDGAGRRALLPSEPAAPLRPEPLGEPALVAHLLLQRGAQRPLQGVAPPALHAAREGRGLGHPRRRPRSASPRRATWAGSTRAGTRAPAASTRSAPREGGPRCRPRSSAMAASSPRRRATRRTSTSTAGGSPSWARA